MKRALHSLPLKVTAIILSFFTTAMTVGGVIGLLFMLDCGFYTNPKEVVQKNFIEGMASSELYDLMDLFTFEDQNIELLNEKYENTNLLYDITDIDGNSLYSNYNNEEYILKTQKDFSIEKYTNGRTVVISDDDWYSVSDPNEYRSVQEAGEIGLSSKTEYKAVIYVKKDFSCTDRYSLTVRIINFLYGLRNYGFIIVFALLIITVILWIFMISSAGHSKEGGILALNALDRVPFDIVLAAATAMLSLCLNFAFDYYDPETQIIFGVISAVLGYFFLLGIVLTAATRIKLRVLLKNTVICKVVRFIKKAFLSLGTTLSYLFSNLNLVWKTALAACIIAAIQFFAILIFQYDTGALVLIWLLGNLILIPALLLISVMLVRLKKGGERLASGEVDAQVDTNYMFGDFKSYGDTLNNIGSGLQTAVNERMKSERMKTELITNVSHDIKTPLTSIINYVDLIKKEDIDNDTVKDYVDVLDRQSTRLKKLIEDLVEASKASTGALRIDPAPCDVGVLLSQATAEYGERFTASGLSTVLNIPENAVTVLADGRYLWRVFDNLFNNICKYAMPSTRVYLDLVYTDTKAIIIFRNISRYPLNISSDELMERFVRGDASRNTEGSGLGLSIAKSLIELQKGRFEINIDGDLFKVQITFDRIKE